MRRSLVLAVLLVAVPVALSLGQASAPLNTTDRRVDPSLLRLTLSSGIDYPIEITDKHLFDLGYSTDLLVSLPFPKVPALSSSAALFYNLEPVRAETSISSIAVGLGPTVAFDRGGRFLAYLSAMAGGYFGFFNETQRTADGTPYDNQNGLGVFAAAETGIRFFLTPYLSVGIDAGYRYYGALMQQLRASVGSSLHLSGFERHVTTEDVEVDPLYPSLYKYYDSAAVGSLAIQNRERFPVSNLSVELFVPQYMERAKPSSGPKRLEPGGAGHFDLYALLSEDVLQVTENTPVAAEIHVTYDLNGKQRSFSTTKSLLINNRNAMVWDDDRKAGAFVGTSEEEVLRFAKMIGNLVQALGAGAVNRNMRTAMAVFDGLASYGVGYVIDPNTPSYEQTSVDAELTDFLQYPTQTLTYKGGDCDDLSILYASLLESLGVETAFITVPGHIFPAFSLDMKPEVARRAFANSDLLIYREGQTWLPVEITGIDGSFIDAWRTGAGEWTKAAKNEQGKFYPVHECWQQYGSTSLPKSGAPLALPSADAFRGRIEGDMRNLAQLEMSPQLERLREQLRTSSNPNPVKNRMGVLYARYGFMDEAQQLFEQLAGGSGYLPALLNLANIHYLQKRLPEAEELYARVQRASPDNDVALLGLARISYDRGQSALVNRYYSELKQKNPELGAEFAYLSGSSDSTARASNAGNVEGADLWSEE